MTSPGTGAPAALRVTVERHPAYPLFRRVTMAIPPEQVTPDFCYRPAEPIAVVVDEDRFVESPAAFDSFPGRLVVEMRPDPGLRIARVLGQLTRLRAVACFSADHLGDGSIPMMLASAGCPVVIDTDGVAPEGALLALAEYFLTSPTLQAPIEPFFTIARHLGDDRRRTPTLRDLYQETLGRHLFIDGERRVTISRRLGQRGWFLGWLDAGLAAWRSSTLWQRLEQFEHRVFATGHRCAFCPHFRCCRGFLRAGETGDVFCSPWDELMEMLRRSYVATLREAALRSPWPAVGARDRRG